MCQAGGSGYQHGPGRLPVAAASTVNATGLQLLMGFLNFVPPKYITNRGPLANAVRRDPWSPAFRETQKKLKVG